MDVPTKSEGTGDPKFDAVYKELLFLRLAADKGGALLFRLLFAVAVLQLAAVVLLAVLVFRG